MKTGYFASGIAAAALMAAPLQAQRTETSVEPQAEQVDGDAALRGRGLLFGLVGAGVVLLLLLLLLDDDTNAQPQPAPPVSP